MKKNSYIQRLNFVAKMLKLFLPVVFLWIFFSNLLSSASELRNVTVVIILILGFLNIFLFTLKSKHTFIFALFLLLIYGCLLLSPENYLKNIKIGAFIYIVFFVALVQQLFELRKK